MNKKRFIVILGVIISVFFLFPFPLKTYQGIKTYQLMSNGTYECQDYHYKYKLELTGVGHGTTKPTTFIVLSNHKNLTFDDVWTAKWTSVSTKFFDPNEAIIVDIAP